MFEKLFAVVIIIIIIMTTARIVTGHSIDREGVRFQNNITSKYDDDESFDED